MSISSLTRRRAAEPLQEINLAAYFSCTSISPSFLIPLSGILKHVLYTSYKHLNTNRNVRIMLRILIKLIKDECLPLLPFLFFL